MSCSRHESDVSAAHLPNQKAPKKSPPIIRRFVYIAPGKRVISIIFERYFLRKIGAFVRLSQSIESNAPEKNRPQFKKVSKF